MQTLNQHKGVIALVILLAVGGFVYNSFRSLESELGAEGGSANIGADLLELSAALSGVTLSQELFSKPSYQILSDFSTEIPQQPIGRPNPFQVIGED